MFLELVQKEDQMEPTSTFKFKNKDFRREVIQKLNIRTRKLLLDMFPPYTNRLQKFQKKKARMEIKQMQV